MERVQASAGDLDRFERLGEPAECLDGGVGDAVGPEVLREGCVGHGGAVPLTSVEDMRLGVHYSNFTHPDWQHRLADRLTETARIADQGGVARSRSWTTGSRWRSWRPAGADAGGLHDARLPRRPHRAAPARPAGHRRDVPPPGPARQDRHHPRRALAAAAPCSASARPGTSASTRGLGVPFPSTSERFERLEETLQICPPDVVATTTPFEGKHYQLAETVIVPPPVQAPPADHDRRRRRAEDAAAGRAVRRRLQPLRRDAGRRPAQARRAARPLRRRRARLRRDREDDDRPGRPDRRHRRFPRVDGGVRRARDLADHAVAAGRRPGRLDEVHVRHGGAEAGPAALRVGSSM